MSAKGYANQDFADESHQDLREEKERQKQELQSHEQTRQNLEGGPEPADDAPETAAEAEESHGFSMSLDRRAGSAFISVEHADEAGETTESDIQFGKPSGRASTQILQPIQNMDDDAPINELVGYIWPTLASWSVSDEYDEDWWADETTLGDAIDVTRRVAFGGNDPTQ